MCQDVGLESTEVRRKLLNASVWGGSGRRAPRPGKLYRARSRLYRSQILEENMRLKALAEIYTMHSFAQLCNLIFFVKICQTFAEISKMSKKLILIFFAKFAKILAKLNKINKNSGNFRKFWQILAIF